MTSILTNMSAMGALKTLRTVNFSLDETQQQVSSGLRVQTAADNVAYWSISTTMKSDNKANSAVTDALGVGAAKIDVAAEGLSQVTDLVSDFRAKLVTAMESSVDRSQVQSDLEELKKQLVAVTTSASFSGVNWLNTSVEEDLAYYSSVPDTIVSSFIRSAEGTVSIGATEVDTADTSVFNLGGGGALQKDIRSLGSIGGFRNAEGTVHAPRGYQEWQFTGAVTLGEDDTITFNLSVDGGAATAVSISKDTIDTALGTENGIISSAYNYSRVVSQALADAGLSGLAATRYSSGTFGLTSREATGRTESSIQISNVQITLDPPPAEESDAGGFREDPITDAPGSYATRSIAFSGPFIVYRDVAFTFDVTLPDKTVERLSVDRDRIDSVLGTSDGWVNTAADLAAILEAARDPMGGTLADAGILVSSSGSTVQLQVDGSIYPDKGYRSWFSVNNITDNVKGANFDLLDVDISNPDNDLENYIDGLDLMLQRVIKGGASLGAAQTRVAMQEAFNQTLLHSIDEGMSRLVDADMEEASARLAAQQAQQQLAVQALQIANSGSQNIMQLFN